jgi:hypothetical protein
MKPTRAQWRPFSVPHLEVPQKDFKEGFFGVPLEVSADGQTARYLVPTAGGHQLGDTAQALQRAAQALNDVDLERLARLQAQWAIGHNPFNVSWICRFGPDSIDQFYSFSQGRMPGCVGTTFGIGNDGTPRCVRPYGGESYTSPGVCLLRALIAVSEPARLRLKLREDGKPWSGPVKIMWTFTGETAFAGNSDADGALPEVKLDGGQRYDLLCEEVLLPLVAISGTTCERVVVRDRALALSASAPAEVRANQAFTVELRVSNRGTKAATTTLRVYAEDATPDQAVRTVELRRDEEKTTRWFFKAGEGNRPYVLFFEPEGDRESGVDATGAILP